MIRQIPHAIAQVNSRGYEKRTHERPSQGGWHADYLIRPEWIDKAVEIIKAHPGGISPSILSMAIFGKRTMLQPIQLMLTQHEPNVFEYDNSWLGWRSE